MVVRIESAWCSAELMKEAARVEGAGMVPFSGDSDIFDAYPRPWIFEMAIYKIYACTLGREEGLATAMLSNTFDEQKLSLMICYPMNFFRAQ